MAISMLLPKTLDLYMLHETSHMLKLPRLGLALHPMGHQVWPLTCREIAPRPLSEDIYAHHYMDVSKNKGTPKSSIFIGFSIIMGQYDLLKFGEPNVSRYLYHKSVASGKCDQSC